MEVPAEEQSASAKNLVRRSHPTLVASSVPAVDTWQVDVLLVPVNYVDSLFICFCYAMSRRGRRRSSSPGHQQDEDRHPWNKVKDHLEKHDQAMTKDLDEDINTLLVFAGLFSAVLTGFVVVSYTWLQPDNGQISAQLLGQLVTLQTTPSHTVISPSPEPFHAAPSFVWINSLWFLALILSLQSALFGMVAKQWLREYMRWTTTSSVPEDLVRLRQARYEAFMSWNVPALITSIPALLEVALVLFMSGLTIFLWTLHTTVAAICTAVIAITLPLALFAVCLPAYSSWCPYRTRIGWIMLELGWGLARIWNKLVERIDTLSMLWTNDTLPLDLIISIEHYVDWRARDFVALNRWKAMDRKLNDPSQVVREATLRATRHLTDEASRIRLLSRSLVWIHRNSQDIQLLNVTRQCWNARHIPHKFGVSSVAVIDFFVALDLLLLDPTDMSPYLDLCYNELLGNGPNESLQRLLDYWHTEPLYLGSHQGQRQTCKVYTQLRRKTPPDILPQINNFLSSGLSLLLEDVTDLRRDASNKAVTRVRRNLILNGLLMLVGILHNKTHNANASASSFMLFVRLFNEVREGSTIHAIFPDLRTIVFEFLRAYGLQMQKDLICPTDTSKAQFYAKAALQTLPAQPDQWSISSCDLFIRLCVEALPNDTPSAVQSEELRLLWERMATCATWSIMKKWRNCGSCKALILALVYKLDTFYNSYKVNNNPSTLPGDDSFPHALICGLGDCSKAELLDLGEAETRYLDKLVTRSHELRLNNAMRPTSSTC